MNRTVVQPGPKRRAADLSRLKRAVECTTSMLTSALWFPFKSQRLSNDLCIPTLALLWLKTFPSQRTKIQPPKKRKKNPDLPTCALPDHTTRAKGWHYTKSGKSIVWKTSSFSNQSLWAKRVMETGLTWIYLRVSTPNGGTGNTEVIFLRQSSFQS